MKAVCGRENGEWMRLTSLPSVRQQQTAFACATGLPLVLLPASHATGLPSHDGEDPVFCVRGCLGDESGPVCRQILLRTEQRAAKAQKPVTYRCPSGLMRIFVPVMVHGRHLGSLMAGPFSLTAANETEFQRLAGKLNQWGLDAGADQLDVVWHHTPVLTHKRSQAVATLVNLFAQYLAECGNRLLLRQSDQPSALMRKIETFLAEQNAETMTLKDVAERVHLSPCHFCKVFKKQTGLTFSEYRTRQRIEKVKRLLLHGQLRVSEAAFEAGFNSIPYFNRAFRRYVGCPPSEYRLWVGGENQDKKITIQA